MKLTKNQAKLYTRCVNAGVPDVFAALVASRARRHFDIPVSGASGACFLWNQQPEGFSHWHSFYQAWEAEFLADGTARRYE